MEHFILGARCVCCDAEYEIRPQEFLNTCPRCGGALDICYDYASLRENGLAQKIFARGEKGVWKYRELLPVQSECCHITMSEGDTGLVEAPTLAREIGVGKLLIKNESQNPTFSFKDRPVAVTVSKAREAGIRAIVAQSTGNAGASLAAYTARVGMKAIILVPIGTSAGKLIQMRSYGAVVIAIEGPCSAASAMALSLAAANPEIANLDLTFSNPYSVEGNKTVAYELVALMPPALKYHVFVPVGSGNLAYGICKGFTECKALGLIDGMPAVTGVQADGCAPVAEAFAHGEPVREWVAEARTVASGINDPLIGYARFGDHILSGIRSTGGSMAAVTDPEILNAMSALGQREGLFAEPASACPVAAVARAVQSGSLGKESTVVCIMSSCGFKEIASSALCAGDGAPPVAHTTNELAKLIEGAII